MKLGISSFAYGWAFGAGGCAPPEPMDEQRLLDAARAHGISLVQFGDNLPLHMLGEAQMEGLAARAGRDGIEIEVGTRGLTVPRIVEYAAIARRLNARLIRVVIDDADYRPDKATVMAILRDLLPFLDGLTLGIENHDRFPCAVLRDIVETVGSERIGICLDTANSLGAGEGLETVVGTLAPITVNLHVKDFQIERLPYLMGFTVSGRPAGAGMMNLPRILEQLAPYGRCRSAILELWTPPEPNLSDTLTKEAASVARSLAYLRPMFGL